MSRLNVFHWWLIIPVWLIQIFVIFAVKDGVITLPSGLLYIAASFLLLYVLIDLLLWLLKRRADENGEGWIGIYLPPWTIGYHYRLRFKSDEEPKP